MCCRPPLYIVDDCPAVRATLVAAVRGEYDEVRPFETAEAVLAVADTLAPGIMLLDLQLPGLSGIALQKALIDVRYPFAVVFLSGTGAVPDAVQALRGGAVDFLQKPYRRSSLLAALDAAAARLAADCVSADRRDRLRVLDRLTLRERDVLRELAKGQSSKVIAHNIGLSTRTVEMHRGNIMSKLQMPITSALLLAQEAGIVAA